MASDEHSSRLDAAFANMVLLGDAAGPLRDMVNVAAEEVKEPAILEAFIEDLELAGNENDDLMLHLRAVSLADAPRLDGTRPTPAEVDAVADSAARALGQLRKRLLDLVVELGELRRWTDYRFRWEIRVIRRKFPPPPRRRHVPKKYRAPVAALDDAIAIRRRLLLSMAQEERRWSLALLRAQRNVILTLWWGNTRRWLAYRALSLLARIFIAVVLGVFAIGAITVDLEYLWGCAIALVFLVLQIAVIDPFVWRALSSMRLSSLADGAMRWGQARIFAAVTTIGVENSWSRVRHEESRVPSDNLNGVML